MAKNTEIERKFLVKSNAFIAQATTSYEIMQGYLCKDPEKTIRVRIRDARAFLTIKSSLLRDGIAKFEWEKEIDLADAKELMKICLPGAISKTRYIIKAKEDDLKWEVDVFHGRLEGRVLAEIELSDEDEAIERPDWLGEEVTGQPQYYNANM
ncbi:MAG: CYTH domain-containing protein [Paludibacteraceae bacterium]|nr:CYTH domain-containing protein [Paludibacteraceae bacterium]